MKLDPRQRAEARAIILRGAELTLDHAPAIHYTQGAERWQGIDHHLRIVRNQFPTEADCSAMATWLLYNAISHALRDLSIPDVLNGEDWDGGYTGTLKDHGYRIGTHGTSAAKQIGDLAHYGGGTGKHVATYIGGGMVHSHGSEGGPYKLPINYRSDLVEVRRYIVAPH